MLGLPFVPADVYGAMLLRERSSHWLQKLVLEAKCGLRLHSRAAQVFSSAWNLLQD